MPKRNLRVTKWIGTTPAIAVCTACNREFGVPLTALKRLANAQDNLRMQFAEHDCNLKARNPNEAPDHSD
ncbi:MAG: hypothetical protein WCC95_03065 [Candidatus Sulfotelmatobacter sp.]|jgi:hypothetical protein